MTPAEKPSMRLSALGFGDLKKATVAAPRAVTDHVPSVASSAITTISFILHPPNIQYIGTEANGD